MTQRTQKQIELKVCEKFVELYNNIFPKNQLEIPQLSGKDDEPPDCETRRKKTREEIKLEVMVASPDEIGSFQRKPKIPTTYEEVWDDSNIIVTKAEKLWDDIKNIKTDKYKKRGVRFEDYILLLEKAHISYNKDLIAQISCLIKKDEKWKNKYRDLGFKEIWYVSIDRPTGWISRLY